MSLVKVVCKFLFGSQSRSNWSIYLNPVYYKAEQSCRNHIPVQLRTGCPAEKLNRYVFSITEILFFSNLSLHVLAVMFAHPAGACWKARASVVRFSLWTARMAASQTQLWELWGVEGRSDDPVSVPVWWPLLAFPRDAAGAPLSSAKQVKPKAPLQQLPWCCHVAYWFRSICQNRKRLA